MNRQDSFLQIFHLMGFAVLEWLPPETFRPAGPLPDWWSLLDAPSALGDADFQSRGRFPFLDNFLIDADDVWAGDGPGKVGSGVWQHTAASGEELMLEAFAVHTGKQRLLIVQHLAADEHRAADYLQTGRVTRLELLRDIARRRQLELELRAAKEAAERLDRAKTEFVANVSHEMRTPLTSILGMSDLLRDGPLTSEQQEHLQQLRQSAESLLTIVNDLLNAAQIETGRVSVHCHEFDVRELIAEVDHEYQPAADERGIELRSKVPDDLPKAMLSDRSRLRQVLNNLVDNAIKFSDEGVVTLAVEATPSAMLEFSVADTGIGISATDRQIVFDSFSQADSSYTRRHGGVGLGLAIASRLISALGGELMLHSVLGEGSLFSFTLPVRVSPETVPTPQVATGDTGKPASRSLHLLVAEDNLINRKFMVHVLAKAGHRVQTAENGQEALDRVAEEEFDVLLLDCQMPVVSGYEVALAVRKREQQSGGHLPIVAVTAHAMSTNEARCRKSGMDFFLSKPFQTKHLLAMVQQAVQHKRKSNPLHTRP